MFKVSIRRVGEERKREETDCRGSGTSRPSWGCSHRLGEEGHRKEREHRKEKERHIPGVLLEEELPILGFAEGVVVATSLCSTCCLSLFWFVFALSLLPQISSALVLALVQHKHTPPDLRHSKPKREKKMNKKEKKKQTKVTQQKAKTPDTNTTFFLSFFFFCLVHPSTKDVAREKRHTKMKRIIRNMMVLLVIGLCVVPESWAYDYVDPSTMKDRMYKTIDGLPCVRLIGNSGPIGCTSE